MEFDCSRNGILKLAFNLYTCLKGKEKPIFLCVGSDKFVCDSLAPIVAETLKNEFDIGAYVYGGLEYNINASNLTEAINYIETIHYNSPIVLIDATLDENVGMIKFEEGCFAGLGRCLPIRRVGTISILGVVGRKGKNFNLNSTRLKYVLQMARAISTACFLATNKLNCLKTNTNRENSTILNY